MIDFTTVSREFNSLVHRRREMLTLLGSVFAGMGIFLQNALQGNLPPALQSVREHLFAFYATILMVTSLVLSLRMARLHAGMVLNGVLYASLMQRQDFTRKGDPSRSARLNWAGASFVQSILVDLIAGSSATILALALDAPVWVAAGIGVAVLIAWRALFLRFHHRAAAFALKKAAEDQYAPFDRNEWETHTAESLENANNDLLAILGFTGLMLFSVLEILSGLGEIKPVAGSDLRAEDIVQIGPAIYTSLTVLTCVLEMVVYLRLRLAVGKFSLELDPSDRPFRPFRLTDSFLGYALLAFLFGVSLHLLLTVVAPPLRSQPLITLGIDFAAVAAALIAEPITLIRAGKSGR